MRVGLASDHGGFALKQTLANQLEAWGYQTHDYGAFTLDPADDYPDFVFLLARAVAGGEVDRGVAICGSGVGACIAANKVPGVRACLIHDYYSAHQAVGHDDLNLMCLGGEAVGRALALDLVKAFLEARYTGEARHQRRLDKIAAFEREIYDTETMTRRTRHAQESAY